MSVKICRIKNTKDDSDHGGAEVSKVNEGTIAANKVHMEILTLLLRNLKVSFA